jgi:hypothetical protein
MKDSSKFKDMISKNLDVRASDRTYNHMRQIVLDAHEPSKQKPSAARLTLARRTIMKSPIVKLAVAAVVIVAVVLGLFEFIGTDSKSGVVWAEVAKKVEASRGVIFRQKANSTKYPGGGSGHSMIYISPTQRRSDGYNKDGEIWISMYGDIEARTRVVVLHNRKGYVRETLSEGNLQQHAGWVDPKAWVDKFLSCEYTKLGQKTIEGIVCEGIETTDPALNPEAADHLQIDRFVARLWVSVETGYPVLLESEFTGKYSGESVMDQFQWDVELDASTFEPNIPPDYEQL